MIKKMKKFISYYLINKNNQNKKNKMSKGSQVDKKFGKNEAVIFLDKQRKEIEKEIEKKRELREKFEQRKEQREMRGKNCENEYPCVDFLNGNCKYYHSKDQIENLLTIKKGQTPCKKGSDCFYLLEYGECEYKHTFSDIEET